jgi:hypothetical protein
MDTAYLRFFEAPARIEWVSFCVTDSAMLDDGGGSEDIGDMEIVEGGERRQVRCFTSIPFLINRPPESAHVRGCEKIADAEI